MKLPFLVTVERIWLFIFLVMIPFSTGNIVERPFAITYINIFSIIFIGLALVNVITGQVPLRPLRDRGTVIVLVLLFATLAYALLFTHPLRNGVGLWTSRLIQPALVGYGVYLLLESGYLKTRELVTWFLISLIPQIIGGALQLFGAIPFRDTNRVTVVYRWPNTFARYIMSLLILSYPFILLAIKNKKEQWMPWAWGLGVLLLLSSISYNGTVSFFAAFALLTLLLPTNFKKFKVITLGTLVVLGVLTAVYAPSLPKWQTSITASRTSRLEFWEVAQGAIKDNLWTGIGIKTWETTYPDLMHKYATLPYENLTSPQPHNFLLDSAIKAGIPGLIVIPLFLIWPGILGVRLLRLKGSKEGWIGLSLVGVAVSLFLFGAIDDPLWSDDMMPFLFMAMAMGLYTLQKERINKATS